MQKILSHVCRWKNSFSLSTSLFVPLALAAILSFTSTATQAVVGGARLDISRAPATVALLDRLYIGSQGNGNIDGQFCVGTVIAKRWVLTAAHCMYDNGLGSGNVLPANDVLVLMGSTELDNPDTTAQPVGITQIFVHQKFVNRQGGHDIALLRLAADAWVTPVALDTHSIGTISQAFAAGWGVTNPDITNITPENITRSDSLQYAFQTMVPGDRCSAHSFTDETMICAGTERGGIGACVADGGGPLYRFTQDVGLRATTLMGISSFSDSGSCHRKSFSGGYTRVASYMNWIRTITRIPFAQTPVQYVPQPVGIRLDVLSSEADRNDWWQIQRTLNYQEVYQGRAKLVRLPPGEYKINNLTKGYSLENFYLPYYPKGVRLLDNGWWQIQDSSTLKTYYEGRPNSFVHLPPGKFYDIINLSTGYKFRDFYVH